MATTRRQAGASASGSTVRQTIVETVEAPRLKGVSTADFVLFKHKREIYERRVEEKNSDPNVRMQLTTYKDSILPAILQIFALGDWVPVDTVNSITETHLKNCVTAHAVVSPEDYDLGRIEEELTTLKLEKADSENNLEAQVWRLILEYTNILNKCGYEAFAEKHPKLAVEHLLKRISHPHLKNRMLITARLKKEEDFRKNFKAFVRELATEARFIDRMNAAKKYKAPISSFDEFSRRVADDPPPSAPSQRRGGGWRGRSKNRGKDSSGDSGRSTDAGTKYPSQNKPSSGSDKRGRELPPCLNPKCDKRHFVDDCEATSDADKQRLKKDYRERKRARQDAAKKGGTVGSVDMHNGSDHTSMFSASFCGGAVETTVLTDQGSDVNLISPSVMKAILKAEPGIEITLLRKPLVFSNAQSKAAKIKCARQISVDVMLRVRHGTNLMLRGIKWLVADEEVQHVFIARHVLSALGLNNRVMLAAAADMFSGVVDIPEVLKKDGQDNTPCADTRESIHTILRDRGLDFGSTFHREGGAEADFLEDSNVYVDFGEDSPTELKKALADLVDDAKRNGLSDAGAVRLSQLLKTYPVFEFGWENPYQPTCHQ